VSLTIGETPQHIAPVGSRLPSGPRSVLPDLELVRAGQPLNAEGAEQHATAIFKRPGIRLHIDLGLGTESAQVWTCDLSLEYVKINADYRS
jgi:glutamate N-acetyltransferase/amino-acid N-acetyltransferase